ncbi:hypothetical protein GGR57DRAFT_497969 [Xylariaceae sp. FL1272]|nr:hypothetical protein GGR57DRAFT_497969 [Xylariaceae sp. FL1272]
MRLLTRNDSDSFDLADYPAGSTIPRTPSCLTGGAPKRSPTKTSNIVPEECERLGYDKIRFCGEQAGRDGLTYFWVDTCCIDKSSSAELTESINSMFFMVLAAQPDAMPISKTSLAEPIQDRVNRAHRQ